MQGITPTPIIDWTRRNCRGCLLPDDSESGIARTDGGFGAHRGESSDRWYGYRAVGGLGAGKTHWTKGFAAGVGANDVVTSPTFGLVHEYRGPALKIFHFDFDRIATEAEMVALGWDEYLDEPAALLVVEWANKFPELLPKRTRWLNFKISPCGGREITWV